MDAAEPVVGQGNPRAQAPQARHGDSADRETAPHLRRDASQRPSEPAQRPPRARLNYDPIQSEIFIEILNPQTGDVIRRFPAERAADEDRALRAGGKILNRFA